MSHEQWTPVPPKGRDGPPGRHRGEDVSPAEQFGRELHAERTRRGWTIEEAAQRAGIAPKTWMRLESGKPVRPDSLRSLDKLFGLTAGTAVHLYHEGATFGDLSPRRKAGSLAFTDAISGMIEIINKTARDNVDMRPFDAITGQLAELTLPELRRLREMIDGIVLVQERPEIEARMRQLEALGLHLGTNIMMAVRKLMETAKSGADEAVTSEAVVELERAQRAFAAFEDSFYELSPRDAVKTKRAVIEKLEGEGINIREWSRVEPRKMYNRFLKDHGGVDNG